MVHTVRIFFSSPGDVAYERVLARKVLKRLKNEPTFAGRLKIEEVSWDDPDVMVTSDAKLSPAEIINSNLHKPSECDLVVVILWSSMGTPSPDSSYYTHAIEYELADALTGPSTVWVYRRVDEPTIDVNDPAFDWKVYQYEAVKRFFHDFFTNGRSYSTYETPSDFERRFEMYLRDWLLKRLEKLTKHEQEVEELVKRLRDGSRLIAVVGGPGSGKSFLINEGILPMLEAGAVPGSQHWLTLRLTPASIRFDNPFLAVATALSKTLPRNGPGVHEIVEALLNEPEAIEILTADVLGAKPANSELLFFFDQFEELFEMQISENLRQRFIVLVETMARTRRVRLILNIRAEYLDVCEIYPRLSVLLGDSIFYMASGNADIRQKTLNDLPANYYYHVTSDDVARVYGFSSYGFSGKNLTECTKYNCHQSRQSFSFPPPFADAWGDDEYGLWAEFQLPLAGADRPVIQRLRWVEPGTFLMGSPEDEPERFGDEGPQHLVTLTRGFWLADTACTQALWLGVMGDNPSRFQDDPGRPVEQVKWSRVQDFLRLLETLLPGARADLPTEAEWEYACRAGTTTPFSFGVSITPEQVNYDGNYPYAVGEPGLYRGTTVLVKSLPANPWGLYEMHGNVWEWCADGLRDYSPDPLEDPLGPTIGANTFRAVRGGSCRSYARLARSACRSRYEPAVVGALRGFRLCLRSIEPGPEPARAAGAAPKGRGGEAGGSPGG